VLLVLASSPKNSFRESLSIPRTLKPFSEKKAAAADPTKPLDPVTITVDKKPPFQFAK
jgi:hypothetical protein